MSVLVMAFGCNEDGQLGLGHNASAIISPVARYEESRNTPPSSSSPLALLASAEVKEKNAATPTVLPLLLGKSVISVSCGSRHTLALTDSGKVFSWGWGKMGQLGHGDDHSFTAPKMITSFVDREVTITSISAGGCHSGAVSQDGAVYTWGESLWGQLGLGSMHNAKMENIPVKVPIEQEQFTSISCGGTHTAAITESGSLYTWGRADSGQLGIGPGWLKLLESLSRLGVDTPQRVDAFDGKKIIKVSCGAFHTAAVTAMGELYMWGKEDYGMLGLGHTKDQAIPQLVEALKDDKTTDVACGGWHTLALTEIGEVYSWGRGEYGRLGTGDERTKTLPVKVDQLSGKVLQIAAGGTHSVFLCDDGFCVKTCGRGLFGRLGTGDAQASSPIPVCVAGLESSSVKAISIAAGGSHSVVVLSQQ